MRGLLGVLGKQFLSDFRISLDGLTPLFSFSFKDRSLPPTIRAIDSSSTQVAEVSFGMRLFEALQMAFQGCECACSKVGFLS